jgi:hypothetical protein
LPFVACIYQRQDGCQVHTILSEGIFPSIKWGGVKRDFQLSLSQFFHQKLQVSFVFVPSVGGFLFVNIDTKMIQESTDAVVPKFLDCIAHMA